MVLNLTCVLLQAARERFNEFMQMAALPADDADVERVRRERREAAAKDGVKLADADLPEKFYKLPRIRFLLLLYKEMLRINRCGLVFFACPVHLCASRAGPQPNAACVQVYCDVWGGQVYCDGCAAQRQDRRGGRQDLCQEHEPRRQRRAGVTLLLSTTAFVVILCYRTALNGCLGASRATLACAGAVLTHCRCLSTSACLWRQLRQP